MARGGAKKKRAQRERQLLERRVAEYQENGEVKEPSGGIYYVLDFRTYPVTKHKGLNKKQAYALWNEIGEAMILSMDDLT